MPPYPASFVGIGANRNDLAAQLPKPFDKVNEDKNYEYSLTLPEVKMEPKNVKFSQNRKIRFYK